MVKIKDVADEAGVAISTVSKVLRNYSKISKETREKVMKAVKELNYVPNTMASALSSKISNRVAFYICITDKQTIDEIYMQNLLGAFKGAEEQGFDIVPIFSYAVNNLTKNELVNFFKSQKINDIVFFGLTKDDKKIIDIINDQVFNVVTINTPLLNYRTSYISIDQALGQYEVAKKTILANNGKRILYLAGRQNSFVTERRIEGIKRLQNELHFDLTIVNGEFKEKMAYEIALKDAYNYDVIVCASDMMAIGVTKALKQLDIFRPVCGFDGIKLLAYFSEGTDTCKQDFNLIARLAMEEIAHLRQGNEGRFVKVPHQIITVKYNEII